MRGEMRQVTIRATARQVDRWEEMGRVFVCKRDVRHFIIFAADLTARRLRERERGRAVPDPLSQRLYEKQLLGARHCRTLAAELAPLLLRGELPDPAPIIDRHQRESM